MLPRASAADGTRARRRLAAAVVAAVVAALPAAACRRTPPPARRGTIVIASAGDAETLLPPLASGMTARQVIDQLFEPLADLGESLNTTGDRDFRPRLARAWRWAPDSLSIAFELDPRARWHDGRPVTAGDVRFTLALYRDPALASAAAADVAAVDSVTAPDARTAVFWFTRRAPDQFYTAAARLRILPAHLLARVPAAELRASDFARRPVGSGPFRFAAWDPQRRIEIVADTGRRRDRARVDRVVWLVAPTPAAALALFLTGDADVYEGVRPEHLRALARRPDATTVPYPALQYGFLVFNLRGGRDADGRAGPPLFADRALRRVLTQALDRAAMLRNVFDTLAALPVGPFTRAQPLVDTSARQLPFDSAAAARALDALGWRPGPDGTRARAGRRLAFTVLAPSSSETRTRYAVLIQEQLRRVGAAVRVEPAEFTAAMDQLSHGRFDAAVHTWALDNPSPFGVTELWGSAAAAGGSNLGGYASPRFDALVDSARRAATPAEARRLLADAARVINDDAPAAWLFEPRPMLALHRRLRPARLRPDAWWAGLADWAVDPDAPGGTAPARDARTAVR